MKRILKEPLLHFLLLGAAMFATYSLVSKDSSGEPRRIVITQGQLSLMMESFTRTRQRPPTHEEWAGLIRDRVREEVYYREALALGMDKDDAIIRRRLQQKMEFVSDDIAAQAAPTDTELHAYLQAHPDKFRVQQQFTFRQLYLNPEKHGANLARDAAQLFTKLNQAGNKADIPVLADPLMLEHSFKMKPGGEIAKQFGDKFAAKLGELAPDQWQGPVESGYGVHLVFISERAESRLPVLAEVREAVRREWDDTRRLETKEKFYQDLLKRYSVTIEPLQPAEELKKLAITQ
jgi:hypothetical protein